MAKVTGVHDIQHQKMFFFVFFFKYLSFSLSLSKYNFIYTTFLANLVGDGLISFEELKLLMKSCIDENSLDFTDEEVDQLTFILFEDADTDHTGAIDFEEMKYMLQKRPGLIESLTTSIEKWLLPQIPVKRKTVSYLARKCNWNYIKNNITSVFFFLLYILINIILFGTRMFSYRAQNIYVMLARGAGIL